MFPLIVGSINSEPKRLHNTIEKPVFQKQWHLSSSSAVPKLQLYAMVMEDNDMMHVFPTDIEEEYEDGVELSVMSLARIDDLSSRELRNVHTIKLKGQVQGVPLLVLVDRGATHNFISHKLVRSMGWPIEKTIPLNVKLGDWLKVMVEAVCRKLV